MNKQKSITIITVVCTALILLVGGTFAWYYDSNKVNLNQIDGAVTYLTKYFESGDGTGPEHAKYDKDGNIISEQGCAYEIKTAEQFYNLAWLQYMGYFNQPEEGGTAIPTTYFYLSADIDMTDYVLPPIGTSVNPFLGNFDGCGHSVTGLTVTNKVNGDGTKINDLPYTLVIDGVKEVEDVEIIGLFGVVGTLDEATTGNESDATFGSYTYSSITNKVQNLYISGLTVETQTRNSLIGVAVGYVNGTVENVGVIDSNIKIDGTVDSLSYTSNLSDYSLVGYCTEAYRDTVEVATVQIAEPEVQYAEYAEKNSGDSWGASIPMQEIFDRLQAILKKATQRDYIYERTERKLADGSTTVTESTSTSKAKPYKVEVDGKNVAGSFLFNPYSTNSYSDQYTYLGGGTLVKVVQEETVTYYNAFRIRNGTYYLTLKNSNDGVTATTDEQAATCWLLDTNGYLFTDVGGTKYYLNANWNSLSVSNTGSTRWTKENNSLAYTSWYGTYYLYYSNGWGVSWNSDNPIKFDDATLSTTEDVVGDPYIDYSGDNVTYFPLKAASSGNYEALSDNTGYIISGRSDTTTSQKFPIRSGDIRVSEYGRSSINDWTPRTITSATDGQVQSIGSDTDAVSYGLKKYSDSNSDFQKMVSSSIYGLHFMNAQISASSKVTADYAFVNGIEYENYEMPTDCIDFSLKEKGIINFFAGTYFDGNNSFFSLHRIIRSGNTITNIIQIDKIYKDIADPNEPYIYECGGSYYYTEYELASDGKKYIPKAFQSTTADGRKLDLVFDLNWIGKRDDLVSNAVYYFEIPLDAGEFALGSVAGGTGAYLMYLDISANAQLVECTAVTEKFVSTINTYERPKGVNFLAMGSRDSFDAADATVTLQAGTSGTVAYSRTGDSISYQINTGGNVSAASTFIEDGITLTPEVQPVPIKSIVERLQRTTVNEYNTASKETVQTVYETTINEITENGVTTTEPKTNEPYAIPSDADVFDETSSELIKIDSSPSSISIDSDKVLTEYYYDRGTFDVFRKSQLDMVYNTGTYAYSYVLYGDSQRSFNAKSNKTTGVLVNERDLTEEYQKIKFISDESITINSYVVNIWSESLPETVYLLPVTTYGIRDLSGTGEGFMTPEEYEQWVDSQNSEEDSSENVEIIEITSFTSTSALFLNSGNTIQNSASSVPVSGSVEVYNAGLTLICGAGVPSVVPLLNGTMNDMAVVGDVPFISLTKDAAILSHSLIQVEYTNTDANGTQLAFDKGDGTVVVVSDIPDAVVTTSDGIVFNASIPASTEVLEMLSYCGLNLDGIICEKYDINGEPMVGQDEVEQFILAPTCSNGSIDINCITIQTPNLNLCNVEYRRSNNTVANADLRADYIQNAGEAFFLSFSFEDQTMVVLTDHSDTLEVLPLTLTDYRIESTEGTDADCYGSNISGDESEYGVSVHLDDVAN